MKQIISCLHLKGEDLSRKGPVPSPSPTPIKVQSVQKLADLVVMEVSSDTTGTPGGVMNVTTSIRNVGTADAGAFVVELYLSADQNLSDEDILLGMGRIPELLPGHSQTEMPQPRSRLISLQGHTTLVYWWMPR